MATKTKEKEKATQPDTITPDTIPEPETQNGPTLELPKVSDLIPELPPLSAAERKAACTDEVTRLLVRLGCSLVARIRSDSVGNAEVSNQTLLTTTIEVVPNP